MWIFLNDAMFSIVEDKNDDTRFMVRARRQGDIEAVFNVEEISLPNSDYIYRASVDKDYVKEIMSSELDRIDYNNFKNSVSDSGLHAAYTKVWCAMFDYQETLYPNYSYGSWWLNYKDVENE